MADNNKTNKDLAIAAKKFRTSFLKFLGRKKANTEQAAVETLMNAVETAETVKFVATMVAADLNEKLSEKAAVAAFTAVSAVEAAKEQAQNTAAKATAALNQGKKVIKQKLGK